MNEEFFHSRARAVREIAEKADPHTRRRLLDLAARYEKKPRPPTPLPSVPARDVPARDAGLTSAVGLVEEILSIPGGGLGVLIDRDNDRVDVPVAPALTRRLLSDVIQRREEG
jgi:hypothetical protein